APARSPDSRTRRVPASPAGRTPTSAGGSPAAVPNGWRVGWPPRVSMTDPLLAPAGPVFSINGSTVPSMARDCVRLEIDEGIEGLRTLRLHLFATGAGAAGPPDRMIYLDGGVVDFGKQLKVAIGPDSGQRTVFDGTISAIEAVFDDGQPPLVVLF